MKFSVLHGTWDEETGKVTVTLACIDRVPNHPGPIPTLELSGPLDDLPSDLEPGVVVDIVVHPKAPQSQ